VNAVCTTRNFANVCWLLGDLSDRSAVTRLDDGPIFFSDLTFYYYKFFFF